MPEVEKSSVIKTSAGNLFRFFLDPSNLSRISPPNLQILEIKASAPLREDSEFTIRARRGFRRLTWHGRVTRLDPPRLMVDEQVRGPFKQFVHRHQFRDIDGHTLLIDHVHYEPPLGIIGRVLDLVFIRRRLRSLFEVRHQRLKELFESGGDEG